MSVTLELRPEIEQRLVAEAAARGVAVEDFLTSIIEGTALSLAPERATAEQFERDLDLLAADSDRLPLLDPEAYNRESIYADHD